MKKSGASGSSGDILAQPPCAKNMSYNSLAEAVSKETPCPKNQNEDKNEKVFSRALLAPLYLTMGYLYLLKIMADSLSEESKSIPWKDPFKSVWWSGPTAFSILYLVGIYFGKQFMKDRPEYQIKPYIFTYNLYQCILNLWCVIAMVYEVYKNPWFKTPWGNYPQPGVEGFRISFLVWTHYNNKYLELLDTLWMVLRKKDRQISFLHCYHHVLLIWAWFFVCKTETGGDAYFGATVNSLIHVIMYGYYTLALLGISCPWKKWITNCQMIQFVACLSHSMYVIYKGNLPIQLPLVQGFVMVNMLVLFGNFYMKNYLGKNEDTREIEKKNK